ncbi:MAG TPA: fatty acid desaturase [Afifellaceae bacterium]|nr:fatty acid desaturase [Afifellaceae bacterium]
MANLDHRTLIAGLEKAERDELLARSDRPGLIRMAVHWGAIVLAAVLIVWRVPFWPVLMVVEGILIVFLFTTLHETIHKTAFRSAWLNDAVASVCGFLIGLPPRWFRYFHFAHHRHTHDPDRDPELASPKPRTFAQYALYLSGLLYWCDQLQALFVNAAGRNRAEFVPAGGQVKVRSEARLYLLLYGLLLGGSLALGNSVLLWIWVVPALLGQPFLRAYLLAEHSLCPHVANMLENSRTTFTNALIRFIAWNMPYHAEHHAYPAVPFHKLPEFHRITRRFLAKTERGYARFHGKYVATLATPGGDPGGSLKK